MEDELNKLSCKCQVYIYNEEFGGPKWHTSLWGKTSTMTCAVLDFTMLTRMNSVILHMVTTRY